jgi:hypothetical protein
MPQEKQRRCPRLGHEITFSYCLTCGDNRGLCWKIADCWWEIFDVVGYLKKHYPAETVSAILAAQPKPKITSILELIEQAKQRAGNKNGGEVDY